MKKGLHCRIYQLKICDECKRCTEGVETKKSKYGTVTGNF